MSTLSAIVASVSDITDDLNKTLSGFTQYQHQITQYSAQILSAIGDRSMEAKECLIFLRSTIQVISDLQSSLRQSIDIANQWIAKNGGSGNTQPSHELTMPFTHEDDEPVHRR